MILHETKKFRIYKHEADHAICVERIADDYEVVLTGENAVAFVQSLSDAEVDYDRVSDTRPATPQIEDWIDPLCARLLFSPANSSKTERGWAAPHPRRNIADRERT